MGDMVYLKMNCDSCGGGIEYPQSACGETIACPHCKNFAFLLYQEAVSQPKSLIPFRTREPQVPNKTLNQPQFDIAELEYRVRQMIQAKFLKDSSRKKFRIKSFSLVHEVGNKYRGVLEVATGDGVKNADVQVTADGRNIIWEMTHIAGEIPEWKWRLAGAVVVLIFIFAPVVWHQITQAASNLRSDVEDQFTGLPYYSSIKSYIKENANDPSSVDIVRFNNPVSRSDGTQIVDCTFRGKNRLGALVLATWEFTINSNNDVVNAKYLEP